MTATSTMHSLFCTASFHGLGHTLLQGKEKVNKIEGFDRGSYWRIVAANIGCAAGSVSVKVYDSLYTHVDEKTKAAILNLFGIRWNGLYLFAIAIATALLFGINPSTLNFNQSDMIY